MQKRLLPGKNRCPRFFLLLFLFPLTLSAQSTYWQTTSGLWDSAANWNGGVPDSSLTATFQPYGPASVQINSSESLGGLFFNLPGAETILSGTSGSLNFFNGSIQNGAGNATIRIAVPITTTGNLNIYNSGSTSSLITGDISVNGSLSIGSGPPSANVYISRINTTHSVGISAGGTGIIDVGLGKDIPQIVLQSGVGTVRVHSIETGYHGNIITQGAAILDLATDYSAISSATSIQVQSLKLSGEGKILVRSDRANLTGVQNLILSGGELVRGAGALNSLQTIQVKANSASTITFETATSPSISAQSLTVDDRSGALLIRGSTLGTGTNRVLLTSIPTLSGSGTVGTNTVGILKQVVVDGDITGSGKDFTTVEASTGIRALGAAEYSSTVQANANVKLVADTSSSGNVTINSLLISGGHNLSASGPITITSGMVLSTGGTNTISAPLTTAGDLSFFTSSDLNLAAQPNPASGIVKYGSGAMTYLSSSGFSKLIINDGTFSVSTGANNNGNVTVNSGGTFFSHGSGKIAAASIVTVNEGGTWELNNGSIQTLQTGILGTGKIFGSGAQVNKLTLAGPNPSNPTVISNQLSGNLSLALAGPSISLTNTGNDYTGITQLITNANLIVGVDQALSANSVLEFDTSSASLLMNGKSATVAGLSSTTGNGTLVGAPASGDAYSQLEVRVASGGSYSFAGTTSGNINIVKTGDGTQTFSANFQDKTNLRVEKGTLEITGQFASDNQIISVGSAGTLLVNILGGSIRPKIEIEAGGIFTHNNFSGPAVKETLTFMGGHNTVFNLLSAPGTFSYTGSFNLAEAGAPVSDVLSLSGLDGQTFVMQLSFDPTVVGGDTSVLRLGWRKGADWVEAYMGNSVVQSQFRGYQSWDTDMTQTLGDWGIDLDSDTVWAVLDHNSDFAVIAVPEPSTYLLFGTGMLILAFQYRRRRA